MAKRFSVFFDSDRINHFSNIGEHNHYYMDASSIKTAKGYISKIKKTFAEDNPRNFRIYDTWGDVDPATDFVPLVYQRDE